MTAYEYLNSIADGYGIYALKEYGNTILPDELFEECLEERIVKRIIEMTLDCPVVIEKLEKGYKVSCD